MKTLRALQDEVATWSWQNFPNNRPYMPLLGAVEEIGELAHAQLKMEQGIRGYDDKQKYIDAAVDALGDIIIYLADYCQRTGIDLHAAVWATWNTVKKRDWVSFPENGGTA